MDEAFTIIGKLYVEILNMQKYIELLQGQIKEKDKKVSELQSANSINEQQ
jgi:hypothetical protein